MKFKPYPLAWIGLLAFPFLSTPSRQIQAVVQAVPTPAPSVQTAPALVQDGAEALRRALLARLEFEELSLQLVGVASFSGEQASTIKHPGATEPMIYRIGDVIGGYRITAIDQTSVTFERNDLKFFLTAGEISDGTHLAGTESAPAAGSIENAIHSHVHVNDDDAGEIDVPLDQINAALGGPTIDQLELGEQAVAAAPDPAIEVKTADDDLKHKTRRFDTAKLIEEVTKDSSSGKRSSSGRMFATPAQGRFTSGFGYRRHPLGGGIKFHRGIDLAAPYGSPVYAAADGVVEKSGWIPTLGNYITIKHDNGYSTRYGHLSRRLAKPGQRISQGDLIGRIGSTGQSTGNHLHFEIRKNQIALDPTNYVSVGRKSRGAQGD